MSSQENKSVEVHLTNLQKLNTFNNDPLFILFKRHLIFPVQKVCKLEVVNQPIIIHITVVKELVQQFLIQTQAELVTNFQKFIFINYPIPLLLDTSKKKRWSVVFKSRVGDMNCFI